MDFFTKQKAAWSVRQAEARYLNAQSEYNKACEAFDKSCQTRNFVNAMEAGHYFIVVREEISVCKEKLKKVEAELEAARYAPKNYNVRNDPLLWLRFNQFSASTWLLILGFGAFTLYCLKIGQ